MSKNPKKISKVPDTSLAAVKQPAATGKPAAGRKPSATTKPSATSKPPATRKPSATSKPAATSEPLATSKLQATSKSPETSKPSLPGKSFAGDKAFPGGKPFDPREFPEARVHGSATRQEIRETTHRVMGSRQSAKPVERSNQHRQPKTGGTGGHGKGREQ